jgi:hypothetical protein
MIFIPSLFVVLNYLIIVNGFKIGSASFIIYCFSKAEKLLFAFGIFPKFIVLID